MELFTQLGLKEISSIAGTLGVSTDIESIQDAIEVDGKRYYYEKEGNNLTVLGDGGKKFSVGIDYSAQKGKDFHNRDVIYLRHEISAKHTFPNGEGITLNNTLSLDPGYESFESVQRHNLMEGLRLRYCGTDEREVASFTLGMNRICLSKNNTMYEFTRQGIETGNRIITVDGEKLVSIYGEEVPSIDEVKSFDLEGERRKIENFLQTTTLHPYTREAIEKASKKLEGKERTARSIIDYYGEDLKNVQEAVAIRGKIEKGVEEGIIPPEVLDAVNNHLRRKVFEIKKEEKTGQSHK